MSLAVVYSPLGVSPVNNPIPLIVSSSYSDEAGFRYKIELLDASNNKVLEVWIYPDTLNSNYGIYDFSMPLSDLISSDLLEDWDMMEITSAPNSYYRYNWRVTEYIGSVSGATLASGAPLHAFRGVVQYETRWDKDNYLPNRYTYSEPWDGSLANFLSNKNKRNYKLTEYGTVNTLFGSFSADISIWTRFIIEVHKFNDLTKYVYYNEIDNPNVNLYNGAVYTIPTGPIQLNTMASNAKLKDYATDIPTTSEIIDVDTEYYNIYLKSGKTAVTNAITIYVDHNCYKHDGVEFLYLGDLGSYETLSLRMADIKSFKTERNEVKSNYYGVKNDQYTYTLGDRGRKNVNIRTNESHTVYSDWIKDEEAEDLMELFRSPDVYIIKNDEIYPIIITNTSYDEKTVRNDRLFNYKVNFDLAYEKYSNV